MFGIGLPELFIVALIGIVPVVLLLLRVFAKTRVQEGERARGSIDPAENALFASSYLEQAYKRMVGKPLSLGVKLVTDAILADRPAPYESVTTSAAFRLGVVNCFALTAAMNLDIKTLGVLVVPLESTLELYKQDRYEPKKVSVQDYLSAFGIRIIFDDVSSPTRLEQYKVLAEEKILAVTSDPLFVTAVKEYVEVHFPKTAVVHPVIKDDGKVAKMELE